MTNNEWSRGHALVNNLCSLKAGFQYDARYKKRCAGSCFIHIDMNPEYYEDLFAGVVAQQITLFLPLIVEKRCRGCWLGAWEAHDLCPLPSREVVDRTFPYTLTMVDRDGAEAMFHNFLYPRPSFVFDEDWCGDLWFDANWRGQVRHKVAVLREAALGR